MSVRINVASTRILLIDNYSSFSQNLVHYLAQVTGEVPTVVHNDHVHEVRLQDFDAVVLSPGPGTPANSEDFGICAQVLEQDIVPVLGICLGHQGLGHLSGAILTLADEPWHGRPSTVVHSGSALFAGIPKSFQAIRYHSLILRDPLPPDLQCIARTSDGSIMALRHRKRPHWSVQFHPESIATEHGHRILENFCRIARGSSRVSNRQGATPKKPILSQGKQTSRNVQKWALRYRHIDNAPSPAQVFEGLYGSSPSAFWLDGAVDQSISYFGDAEGPHGYRLAYDVSDQQLTYSSGKTEHEACSSVFSYLDSMLATHQLQVDSGLGFDFQGGFVGYFGYELKGELGAKNLHRSPWPDAQWLWVDRFIAYDHLRSRATLVALQPADCDEASGAWFDDMESRLRPTTVPRRSWETGALRWRDSAQTYTTLVDRCLRKITDGQSYELCLTTQLSIDVVADGLELFMRMRQTNPAPYAAFLRCNGFELASASPEQFLRIDGTGGVQSKPIKGTAGRDDDPMVDQQLAENLATSDKERAENLMIVDLVRHDLAQTCEVGSVKVESFAAIESYSSVHQLVSTVRGQLRPDATPLQCVAAAFPGGSMTGAPKKRAMEILDALETGPRGPYAGSLGYLSMTGAVDLSIIIRSALVESTQVHLGVGGAVTALSNPQSELEEMQLKSAAQVEALLGR